MLHIHESAVSDDDDDEEESNPVAADVAEPTLPTLQVAATSSLSSPKSIQDFPSHREEEKDAVKLNMNKHATKAKPSSTTNTAASREYNGHGSNGSGHGSSSNNKLHLLADQVRQLTEQVHTRDRQIRGMKEKVNRCTDLESELDIKQTLLSNTLGFNEGMREVVNDLNVELSSRDNVAMNNHSLHNSTTHGKAAAAAGNTGTINTATNTPPVDEHPLKLERDTTLLQAGELSMKLANVRACQDELRDELADAIEVIKKQYKTSTVRNNTKTSTNSNNSPANLPRPHSPSHAATYHAVAPVEKISTLTDSPKRSIRPFLWPGSRNQHQATVPQQQQNIPQKNPCPIPAWMAEILDNDHTEGTEDESDSERSGSGSFPAHVTVHTKTKPKTASINCATCEKRLGDLFYRCPCLAVHYCGADCQKKGWKDHRKYHDIQMVAQMKNRFGVPLDVPVEDLKDVQLTQKVDGLAL
jgi:hypothetical protein